MKATTFVGSVGVLILILTSVLSGGRPVFGQTLEDILMFYTPEDGIDIPPAEACVSTAGWPDSGCYCIPHPFGHLSAVGYPMRWEIFAGLNDTVQFRINFFNTTDTVCDLSDKDCEHWYVPRLYLFGAMGRGAPLLQESDKLGYRIRGWFSGLDMAEPQKELPPLPSGGIGLIMDIWHLPQGRFQICLEPTEKVPSDFVALTEGLTYEFYPPQSLADSLNAFEGCYWRAIRDKDYDAAEQWVNRMLEVNPTSVPGHWLKTIHALEVHDTATAKQALDDALKFLDERADPALPDSTQRALFQAEKLYLDELHRVLSDNRRRLGP